MRSVAWLFLCLTTVAIHPIEAATLRVCASGCAYTSLQPAIDAAQPGDTILLRAGETFAGPFVLRNKPGSNAWIEIRSDASDASLPATGVRLVPSGKPGANTSRSLLARLIGRGGTYRTTPVISTEPGARFYALRFLEIDGSESLGWETLMALGDHTSATPASDIIIDRVYAHGHFTKGQKRGIALNSGRTEILNSYISDIRAVGFDTQAIGGYNGTGPYKIHNNYLEAAGENIMFGGEDPAVYGLIPSNIEISRNHIYKPTAWSGAILPMPTLVRALDSGTGGALTSGTHYFRVVAVLDTGPVTANSLPSIEERVTLPGSRTATISWAPVAGAERYRIYRGVTSGGQFAYMETPSSVATFSYTGVGERSGTPPTSASEWTIKNLIELKNAQNVLVDGNVIENIWAAAQNGYAIVLTPANQYGRTPWVVVRDVTFTNNVIRNAASVLTLTGRDVSHGSQPTQRITFRNNLIYDIDPNGSYAKTFVMGESPSTVTIDRNTIIHENSQLVFPYGGQIPGFSFTNNVTLHNQYGIMGDGGRSGTYSIDMYFPGGIVTNNVLAGGDASLYPTPNAFPTLAQWNTSFASLATHDYRILSSSVFYAAGAGGSVPGADLGRLYDATLPSGGAPTTTPPPTTDPQPSSNTAPVARAGGPYTASVGVPFQVTATASTDTEGPIASYLWRFNDEIVIQASDVAASAVVGGAWTKSSQSGAANGVAILNTDRGAGKVTAPLAAPSSYVDVSFYAASGVPYRIWVRSRATADSWANDSMFMQFSGRVDESGRAIHRIGTTSAATIFLEDSGGAGVSGWGWNDEVYGPAASVVYFATSGPQTLRLQQREDGIAWDQIVISAETYKTAAPGPLKNDSTIVPRTLGTSASAVPTYEYGVPGQYPLALTVVDGGGLSATALTSVTVSTGGGSPVPGGGGIGELNANHGGPYSGTTGTAVAFDGSRSSSSTNGEYLWLFGDDIVLGASDFTAAGNRWRRVADTTAANGMTLENPEAGEAKVGAPSSAPGSYVEASFRAAAGVPYRVWIRMRAANDSWTNDSVFVQFSGSVTASGAAANRIGSTQGLVMFLEDGSGAGLSGWGWGDNGFGTPDTPVYFNNDGVQRIRILQREDGVRIDQVVISAGSYADRAPGLEKNDTTIVPAVPAAARGAVVSHVYRFAGAYPATLTIRDGLATAIAVTFATIR